MLRWACILCNGVKITIEEVLRQLNSIDNLKLQKAKLNTFYGSMFESMGQYPDVNQDWGTQNEHQGNY